MEEVLHRITETGSPVMFAGYELGRETLGHGAMGTVVRAREPATGREVALKVLHRRPSLTNEVFARESVLREAKMMAGVVHDNVVTVDKVGFNDGQAWIAMELVRGPTLRAWQSEEHLWSEVLSTYVAAGRGLAAAHARGILHGDFKPDNVLIAPRGTAKLGDFGLATLDDDDDELGGTLRYMAPEQLRGEARTVLSEQFSFAVALFEGLTGTHPYLRGANGYATTLPTERDSHTPNSVRQRYRDELLENIDCGTIRWPRLPLRLPRRVRGAIERSLDYDPGRRFPRLDDLLDALDLPQARSNLRRLGAIATTSLIAGAALTGALLNDVRSQECVAHRSKFANIWNADALATVHEHHAPPVAGEVEQLIDRLEGRWVGSSASSCERTVMVGDSGAWKPVRRCLDRQLDKLQLILSELPKRDSRSAVDLARGLSKISPSACAFAGPDVDEDAGEDLRKALNTSELHLWAKDFDAGIRVVEGVLDDAKEQGLLAVEAEARYLLGSLLLSRSIRSDKEHLGASAPGMTELLQAEIAALAADVPAIAVDAIIARVRAQAVMHEDPSLELIERLADDGSRFGRLLKEQNASLLDIRAIELYNAALRGDRELFASAEDLLRQALATYESLGLHYEASRAEHNLAKILIQAERPEEAAALLDRAATRLDALEIHTAYEAELLADAINARLQLDDLSVAQRVADVALSRLEFSSEERLPMLLPAIYAFWGEPRALALATEAVSYLDDPAVNVTPIHSAELRIAALGVLVMDPSAPARLPEIRRWSAALAERGEVVPEPAQQALALAYRGRAELLNENFSRARDHLLSCREHRGWTHLYPETKAVALLDLAESLLGLEHPDDARITLADSDSEISQIDDETEHRQLETRSKALRARLPEK